MVWSRTPSRSPSRRPIIPIISVAALILILILGYTILGPFTGFVGRTFWDWIGLIGVSGAIGVVGVYLARQQRQRDEAVAAEQAQERRFKSTLTK